MREGVLRFSGGMGLPRRAALTKPIAKPFSQQLRGSETWDLKSAFT
jgi:hypothetical protein